MPKRSGKAPKDLNETAFNIVQQLTSESNPKPDKNPYAQALGKLGGSKGGKARAKNLSKKALSKIGKMGAKARWGK